MNAEHKQVSDHYDASPEAHAKRAAALRATIPVEVQNKVKAWKMTSAGIALAPFAGKTWQMKTPMPFDQALDWFANVSLVGIRRHGFMAFEGGGHLSFESDKFSSMREASSEQRGDKA